MAQRNPKTNRSELEAYEMDAYIVGRSLGEERQVRTHVVRREVYLDEHGRPAKLVEEVIDINEDI